MCFLMAAFIGITGWPFRVSFSILTLGLPFLPLSGLTQFCSTFVFGPFWLHLLLHNNIKNRKAITPMQPPTMRMMVKRSILHMYLLLYVIHSSLRGLEPVSIATCYSSIHIRSTTVHCLFLKTY